MRAAETDRAAVRELVERYAQAVDRADGAGVAALFLPGGVLALWMDPASAEPTGERCGRDAITAAVDGIRRYDATHHTISSHISKVDGDRATGETLCTAHHVSGPQGSARTDRVLYLRYLDTFVRSEAGWSFERREVRVQWASTLPVD